MYTVIKQKMKNYNSPCVVDANDIGRMDSYIRANSSSSHAVVVDQHSDMKSKFKNNNVQQISHHFDMWSEKYPFKDHTVHSAMCDVQAGQFRNAGHHQDAHNRSSPTAVMASQQQIKNVALQESPIDSTDLTAANKIDSTDFLNCCLDNSKVNDQKYRDTLAEFETSFEFDIHCHTRTSDSFHERIVDKCLEERVKDQIGENDGSMLNKSNDIAQAAYDCDFQSGYLMKKILDENKNKTEEIGSHVAISKVDTNDFRCPTEDRRSAPDDYHPPLKSDTNCCTIENRSDFNKNLNNFNFNSDVTPKSPLRLNGGDNEESCSVKNPMPSDCSNEINSNYKLDGYEKRTTDSLQAAEAVTGEIESILDLTPDKITDDECNSVPRNDSANILKTNINVVSVESKNEVIEIHEFVRCDDKSVNQNIHSANVPSPSSISDSEQEQTESTVLESIPMECCVSQDEPLTSVKTHSPEIGNVEQEQSNESDLQPVYPLGPLLDSPSESPVVRSPPHDVAVVFSTDSTVDCSQKPLSPTSPSSVCENTSDYSAMETDESGDSSDDEREADLESKRILELIYNHLESLDVEEETESIVAGEMMETDNKGAMLDDNGFETISDDSCSEPIAALPKNNPENPIENSWKENRVESTSAVEPSYDGVVFSSSDTGQKNENVQTDACDRVGGIWGAKKTEETFKTTRGHETYRLNKVETPRIKFMLKCKNMIRKNVFDSEAPTVSSSAAVAVVEKPEILMSSRISEYGSAAKGDNDDRINTIIGDVQTASQWRSTVDRLNNNDSDPTLNAESIISKPDLVVEESDSNSIDCCYATATPVPSPVDDFPVDDDQAEKQEAGGEAVAAAAVAEFWDKSLETEYKNVLRKTISKLTTTTTT
ncbi:MAG: hypothetical protein ACRYE8_04350, partial [Janthinobacterium lividum]